MPFVSKMTRIPLINTSCCILATTLTRVIHIRKDKTRVIHLEEDKTRVAVW